MEIILLFIKNKNKKMKNIMNISFKKTLNLRAQGSFYCAL
jgi:hypothetical protein